MIRKTLYFGNPARLSTANRQLVIALPGASGEKGEERTIPLEDIGLVILDHAQITLTQPLMAGLLENNAALITCDSTHHPAGMLLNLEGNSLQSQKFRLQAEASLPLKKQLWQQTVAAKIQNQAHLLRCMKKDYQYLLTLSGRVKSGDSDNLEAMAAAYYWKRIFDAPADFRREREGVPPNNLLNYGYAILRALVARALVGSGLLPTLGIFHRNQYNAFCLADDIMEPYRPFVDRLVAEMPPGPRGDFFIAPGSKKILLGIPALTVLLDNRKSPLMTAVSRTTASLCSCFEGQSRKIAYPVLT